MKLWMDGNGRKRDDKENLGESVRRGGGSCVLLWEWWLLWCVGRKVGGFCEL